MEHSNRYKVIWRILRAPVALLLLLKFNFRTPKYKIREPFILLSNHVTDWDPLMVGCAFDTPMHFVASEHIFRLGFLSKLLVWALAPIARQKGGNAAGTVKAMLRTLKGGQNVGIFPEGNRTWDGMTRSVTASTGKLVRSSGASLVTYRLHGGYFSSPRWAGGSVRRGRMRGEIVNIYSPEQLRSMSVDEINARIAEDLRVDAYAEQRSSRVRYKGRRIAEHIETLFFTCPVCGAMHSIASKGDRVFCSRCGMQARYTQEGFFEGDLPFETVSEWNTMQDEKIRQLCSSAGEDAIFSDSALKLYRVETASGRMLAGEGTMTLYRDRLVLPGGKELALSSISGMALVGADRLYIGTSDASSYEIIPDGVCSTHKYLSACIALGCPVSYGI